MNLGTAIKRLRKEKTGLNQNEYAQEIGITQSYLSQLECGEKKPSVALMESIAKYHNTPLPAIFWFAVEESDVDKNKIEVYRLLKPSIDNLVLSFI